MDNEPTALCEMNQHGRCAGMGADGTACGCECHTAEVRRMAHAAVERMRDEGRTRKDFIPNAVAVHYSALERKARAIIRSMMPEAIEGRKARPVDLWPPQPEDIQDTAEMMFGIYERGLEDGKVREKERAVRQEQLREQERKDRRKQRAAETRALRQRKPRKAMKRKARR